MTDPTPAPDWRALCQELLDALENAFQVMAGEGGTQHISTATDVLLRADAHLATPPDRLRQCPTHGQQSENAWVCPECVRAATEKSSVAQSNFAMHRLATPPAATRETGLDMQPTEFRLVDIGDGKPVQVQVCPNCGIAPGNVDDCGRFGDPGCPYFGIGHEAGAEISDEEWDALKDRLWDLYETVGHQGERIMWPGAFDKALDRARKELGRWGGAAVQPVPVSERPWERPGWCDAEGRCWRFDPCENGWWSYGYPLDLMASPGPWTHMSPHWALPVPAADEGEVRNDV